MTIEVYFNKTQEIHNKGKEAFRVSYTGDVTVPTTDTQACPGCGSKIGRLPKCNGHIKLSLNRYFHTVLTCIGTKRTKRIQLTTDETAYLFGAPHLHLLGTKTTIRSDVLSSPFTVSDTTEPLEDEDMEPDLDPNYPKTEEIIFTNLVCVHWNTDTRAKHRLGEILTFANSQSADIITLNDTQGVRWSHNALLDLGWTMYRHKGCMILLNIHTAERIVRKNDHTGKKCALVWESEKHESMYISLDTKEGPVMISTSYAPPNVDKLPWPPPDKHGAAQNLVEQYEELREKSKHFKFHIHSTDANETDGKKSRIAIHKDGHITYSGNTRANNSLRGTYLGILSEGASLIDGHRHLHGHKTEYPCLDDMTNVKTLEQTREDRTISTVHGRIDYTLCSKSLKNRIMECTTNNATQHWANTTKKDFHKALVTSFDWTGLWLDTDVNTPDTPLLGSALPAVPNYHRMTPERASRISRLFDNTLRKLWPRIKGTWTKGPAKHDKGKQRDILLGIFKKELLRVAKCVLGTRNHRPPEEPLKTPLTTQWDTLTLLIGRALGHTLHVHFSQEPQITLSDPTILGLMSTLTKALDITFPQNRTEWDNWWLRKDTHKADAFLQRRKLILTDEMAATQPGRFYKAVSSNSTGSPHISSIREGNKTITSAPGIEKAFTTFVTKLADLPEEEISQETEALNTHSHTEDNRLEPLMDKITLDDLISATTTTMTSSSPGKEGISPFLLKTILRTTWTSTIRYTQTDKRNNALDHKFNHYLRENTDYGRNILNLIDPREIHTIPPPESLTGGKEVQIQPIYGGKLLLRILNLCLETKDVPLQEKNGVITGLPKSMGLVNSTDDIRPITVGPAIHRLLHKIMADRLSTLLVRFNKLDRAQFAFLPCGDVHEPIGTATACYREAYRTKKEIYAIYYDVSKAYDTVRWSSIRSALEKLEIPENFIMFVMNTLKGSRIMMRTNVQGNITPAVELKKTIKQGCPLAPLLFIILMDTLHKDIRTSGTGFDLPTKGQDTVRVSSRGYCDDTWIVSDSLDGIHKANEIVETFFKKHHLQVNATKTKVTGKKIDGSPFTDRLGWASDTPFPTIPPNEPIRYLGIQLTLNLDWQHQILEMQTKIMTTLSHLKSGRLSLFQACCLTRFVTGPKLEAGMRHAELDRTQLAEWDKWLSSALTKTANYGGTNLHSSSVFTICKITPLSDQYDAIQCTYSLERIIRDSELRQHYQFLLCPMINEIDRLSCDHNTKNLRTFHPRNYTMTHTADVLKHMATRGVRIGTNKHSVRKEATPGRVPKEIRSNQWTVTDDVRTPISIPEGGWITSHGCMIPYMDTHKLWGKDFDKLSALLPQMTSHEIPKKQIRQIGSMECILAHHTKSYHHPTCKKRGIHLPDMDTSRETLKEALTSLYKRCTCSDCTTGWKHTDYIVHNITKVSITTDGSTYPGIPSGAALTFIEDDTGSFDLWNTKGLYWGISASDNFMAEISAIDRAIRTIPVNVNLHIHTDSQASIDSIHNALRSPERFNPLRKASRPYIRSILRAIQCRTALGSTTNLHHVRSHTSGRDPITLGNAEADRLAKHVASRELNSPERTNSFSLLQNELPFVLFHSTWSNDTPPNTPTELLTIEHGDVRKAIKTHLRDLSVLTWARRPVRGHLIHKFPKQVLKTIDWTWKNRPSSNAIALCITVLNKINTKINVHGQFVTSSCSRCGTGASNTTIHRLQLCPRNIHHLNEMDTKIAHITGYTPHTVGPDPSAFKQEVEETRVVLSNLIKSSLGQPTNTERTIVLPNTVLNSGNQPSVRVTLDTITDIGRISLLYRLERNRKDPTTPPIKPNSTLDRWIDCEDRQTLVNITLNLALRDHHDLASSGHHTQCKILRDISRDVFRTYCDLHYNPMRSEAPWDSVWLAASSNTSEAILGATVLENPPAFMSGRYTWICLSQTPATQTTNLNNACLAANTSNGPTRIVLLLTDTQTNRTTITQYNNNGNTKVFIVLEIPPQTVPLETPTNSLEELDPDYGLPPKPKLYNPTNLIMVLVENQGLPGFSILHLRTLLETYRTIKIHTPTWKRTEVVTDIQTDTPTGSRNHPLLRPSQSWYRPECNMHPKHPRDTEAPRLNTGDTLDSHLTILGVTPKGLYKNIGRHHENNTLIRDTVESEITEIIFDTTLAIFTKADIFHLPWKQGFSPAPTKPPKPRKI
jgi:ribonuclease HI/exonuclease III